MARRRSSRSSRKRARRRSFLSLHLACDPGGCFGTAVAADRSCHLVFCLVAMFDSEGCRDRGVGIGLSGERTRPECWFPRPAETNFCDVPISPEQRALLKSVLAGRQHQHSGRVRSQKRSATRVRQLRRELLAMLLNQSRAVFDSANLQDRDKAVQSTTVPAREAREQSNVERAAEGAADLQGSESSRCR